MIGVYEIRCDVNNRSYIGQSTDIDRRWKQHIYELNNNKHINTDLQGDWNKYTRAKFTFTVLKECEPTYLNLFEAYYIELFETIRNGYNDATVSRLCRKDYKEFERISHINSIDIKFNLRTLVFAKALQSVACVTYPSLMGKDVAMLNQYSNDGVKEEILKVIQNDSNSAYNFETSLLALFDSSLSIYTSIEKLIVDKIFKMTGVKVTVIPLGWEFGKELELLKSGCFEINIEANNLVKTITVNVMDDYIDNKIS